jgi:CheY-like chemotaxis protein
MTANSLVLIVEDSLDIQVTLKEFFEYEGYEVLVASNGKIALEVLQNTPKLPNLILLDLMMPVMDGHEFMRRKSMNDRFKNVPVVVMTANGTVSAKNEASHAKAFLNKPVDIDYLLETVQLHLN